MGSSMKPRPLASSSSSGRILGTSAPASEPGVCETSLRTTEAGLDNCTPSPAVCGPETDPGALCGVSSSTENLRSAPGQERPLYCSTCLSYSAALCASSPTRIDCPGAFGFGENMSLEIKYAFARGKTL